MRSMRSTGTITWILLRFVTSGWSAHMSCFFFDIHHFTYYEPHIHYSQFDECFIETKCSTNGSIEVADDDNTSKAFNINSNVFLPIVSVTLAAEPNAAFSYTYP